MIALTGLILIVSTLAPVRGVTPFPEVEEDPNVIKEITAVEGSKVILPCSASDQDQEVIWVNPRKILISLGDRRMLDDSRMSIERPYVKIWNLMIRTVRYNDSGIYECRINSVPKKQWMRRLEVRVPPVIHSEESSDNVILQEGQTATLVCNVSGVPAPNVTWYKRNYRQIDVPKESIGNGGEVLKIRNISRHCDDIYECFVDNGVPPAVSKAIRVAVDYKPEVVVPTKRIGQRLRRETILECQIFANPQGVTAWKRNGVELKTKTTGNKYDIEIIHNDVENSITLALRIRNLSPSDYGPYQCMGSNYLGEDVGQMVVYEIKPPRTTTTTTTTTPPVIRIQSGHHHHSQGQGSSAVFVDDRYPHTNRHRQGNGEDASYDRDGEEDEGAEGDYRHGRVHGSEGDREDSLREWERQNRIGHNSPDSSSLNSQQKGSADADQTWSVFGSDNGDNPSMAVTPCVWLTTCLPALALLCFLGWRQ